MATWIRRLPHWVRPISLLCGATLLTLGFTTAPRVAKATAQASLPDTIVIAYNDLGMHCMNEDFSQLCILPPANTMRATVIDRTHGSPEIVTSGVSVLYDIPGNTTSVTKTNFWTYAQALFGAVLPPNVGLFGNGLSGSMHITADRDFIVEGIPVTPKTDAGQIDPYQLARIRVVRNGQTVHTARPVIPVSWEISCNSCHYDPSVRSGKGNPQRFIAGEILTVHDRMHGTNLKNQKPVLCASCHADPALGTPGQPGVSNLSRAMHASHANRMLPDRLPHKNECYSCHPGVQTECQRDVHSARGMTCNSCHGTVADVGNATRRPWVDLPTCGSCHQRTGFEFEEPGKLFRDSKGHGGVKCIVCHNSPHATLPATNPRDNVQMTQLQGHAGTLNTCSVCHSETPSDPFPHRRNDD